MLVYVIGYVEYHVEYLHSLLLYVWNLRAILECESDWYDNFGRTWLIAY